MKIYELKTQLRDMCTYRYSNTVVFCSQVSYLGVDILMLHRPPLMKDKYFDDEDLVLPYTEAAAIHKKRTFRGSVHYMQ